MAIIQASPDTSQNNLKYIYKSPCRAKFDAYNALLGWGDPTGLPVPERNWSLFNKQMKTDVWALVGVVVTTIQTQQVTH